MASKQSAAPPEAAPGHPIQVVVRRTGLSPDVLRVWERRHDAVRPSRSAGRQRLYTEADIVRLGLLGQLTRRGHRIGELAQLPVDELRSLMQQDVKQRAEPSQQPQTAAEQEQVDSALSLVERLDAGRLEALLEGAVLVMGAERFLDSLAFPLLRKIGERWSDGRLRPDQEHLATIVVRRTLTGCLSRMPTRPAAPAALFTTPSQHRHELGALAAAIACAGLGWRAVFLGADMPADHIAAAAAEIGARVVGLSVACDEDRALTCSQVRLTAEALPENVTLIVGGNGAGALAKELDAAGATVVTSLAEFRELLGTLES